MTIDDRTIDKMIIDNKTIDKMTIKMIIQTGYAQHYDQQKSFTK
jgi:hypothetical protein